MTWRDAGFMALGGVVTMVVFFVTITVIGIRNGGMN